MRQKRVVNGSKEVEDTGPVNILVTSSVTFSMITVSDGNISMIVWQV